MGANNTLLGSKVSVLSSDILELARRRIQDLNIGGQIAFPIDLSKLVVVFIRNAAYIQFMVTDCEQVIIDVLKNWI